jgi:predicted NAD/FAD-dependent oxidoreductase
MVEKQPMNVAAAAECWDAVVIGGGIAGLSAAGALAAAGRRVLVLDKSRGVGGRMATRRIGGAVCDHGAQFFTVRTGEFATVVEDAVRAAAVAEWCRGFSRDGSIGVDGSGAGEIGAGDGHPRYRGGRGMTDLPKWLAARLGEWGDAVEIRTAAKVASIAAANGGVRITIDREGGGSEIIAASGVVLTPPVPQALELMQAGGLLAGGSVDQEAIESLRTVDYDPCFTALLVLDRPSLVPPPGAIQFAAHTPGPVAQMPGPLAWIADNQQKGISTVPALTVHATSRFSREYFDTPLDEVGAMLIAAVSPWIDGDPATAIVERSVHRWKFAAPTTILPERCVAVSMVPLVVCCGDAFAGPRVEGAATSGMAAGRWLADRLSEGPR